MVVNNPKMKNFQFSQEQEILQGTVIFRQNDCGSKSERVKPFLYCNKDMIVPLFKKGDNPFENNILQEYDGKQVEIIGEVRNDVFEITNIKKVL
ncbi:hypothetical protein [Fibrobacter sp. UWB12]|jgi:hypothetical protein|uniref:hypothetical protein n=1 Tax=Fibrobacter sp. UWB12 TaxID=1896203 RepID=UPI00091A8DCC|nr:hypothetical protein [Fibrobacter sp. UWB12]SHK66640.1 hypothetical protein SAMN05720759_10517 [Fibrobacter sp. UWB12]